MILLLVLDIYCINLVYINSILYYLFLLKTREYSLVTSIFIRCGIYDAPIDKQDEDRTAISKFLCSKTTVNDINVSKQRMLLAYVCLKRCKSMRMQCFWS